MSSRSASPHPSDAPWLLLLCVGLPLFAALLLGGDSNWDLRNYHLYGPHALLHERSGDIAAAQLQGWHNPLLDVPMYLLATLGAPAALIRLWLATPAMLALFCLLRLQGAASVLAPTRLSQLVLALLALGGAATWSTFALSMNDGFVGAAVVAALAITFGKGEAPAPARRWLFAGLLLGAMTGLKMSAAFYCIALAATAWVGSSTREALTRSAWLLLGGSIGIALSYGAWGWQLFQEHGNPFFPYFNQWFHSPDALAASYTDARFRPQAWSDWLLAPVHLLHSQRLFSEEKLRDPRLLLGLIAYAWLAFRPEPTATRKIIRALGLFLLLGFALWLVQSAIYRYATGLELLASLALVLAAQRSPRFPRAALLLLLVLVSVATHRPHWGRDASAESLAHLRAPALGSGAMVLTASGDPLGYLALGLPNEVPMIGVANNFMNPQACTRLQVRVSQRIGAHSGPVWLLEVPHADASGSGARELLRRHYGFEPSGQCLAYPNPLAPAALCPLRRVGAPIAPCLDQRR